MRSGFPVGLLAGCAFSLAGAALAQITPDGSTNTTVSIGADGVITVGVAAPGNSGVSINNYSDFNVPAAGADLDNRAAGARTIVNEVTSARVSNIEGPLEVLGQRAHVIVSNPNGIFVDGGSFLNTGQLVLTTGNISTVDRDIGPGNTQTNVVATVNGGRITVAGGGLSGQMDAVNLIAEEIVAAGVVENGSTASGSALQLVAGQNVVEFASSFVPGNPTSPEEVGSRYLTVTSQNADANAVLIEVALGGALRANSVEIEASGVGAGVRYAGEGQARARGFVLRADGEIDLGGADISAAGQVEVNGGSLNLQEAQIVATNETLRLNAAEAAGIRGGNFELSGPDVALTSAGDIAFSSDAAGGALIQALDTALVVEALGDISDIGTVYESGTDLRFVIAGNAAFSGSTLNAGEQAENTSDIARLWLDIEGDAVFEAATLGAEDSVWLEAASLRFGGGEARTEVISRHGALRVDAETGGIALAGALLQGAAESQDFITENLSFPEAVYVTAAGNIESISDDLGIAAIFAESGDLTLFGEGSYLGNAARLLANGSILVDVAGDFENVVDLPGGSADPEILSETNRGSREWRTLWLKRKRTRDITYDYGELDETRRGFITASSGNVEINAANILNRGSEINANDGSVLLNAAQNIEHEAVAAGRVTLSSSCLWTCRYEGGGSVSRYGGINASQDVELSAGEVLGVRGGEIRAVQGDITIGATNIELEALQLPFYVERPSGFYNFWRSRAGWIYLRDQFGGVLADIGQITVNSDHPVALIGVDAGEITGAAGVEIAAGTEVVRAPETITPVYDQRLGHFDGFATIKD